MTVLTCSSTLINCDRVNVGILNDTECLFLENQTAVLFLSDIAFKALLTIQVNMYAFDGAVYK